MCTDFYSIIQNNVTALKIPCAIYSPLPPPKCLPLSVPFQLFYFSFLKVLFVSLQVLIVCCSLFIFHLFKHIIILILNSVSGHFNIWNTIIFQMFSGLVLLPILLVIWLYGGLYALWLCVCLCGGSFTWNS